MKKAISELLRGAFFLFLLLLLLLILSFVFHPKGNSAADGMYDANPNGILAEPKDTVDVLFLGNSEADCAFLPQKLWADYGISSYICGLGGGNPNQSAAFLRQAFRTQHPRLVILEAHHLFGDFSLTDDMLLRLEGALPILRYHNRWKSLMLQDFTSVPKFDSLEYQKGYHFDWRIQPADTSHYMAYTDAWGTLSGTVIQCVEQMKQLCEKNGAKMLIVSSPSTINWNYYRHNSIERFAQQMQIPFLDMNLMTDEIPIDWTTESQDAGDHVNFAGAKKVTAYLGKMLWETGEYQDRRGGPESENWDWVISEFLRINELPPDALQDA